LLQHLLIAEHRGALARATFRRWITAEAAADLVELLERQADDVAVFTPRERFERFQP